MKIFEGRGSLFPRAEDLIQRAVASGCTDPAFKQWLDDYQTWQKMYVPEPFDADDIE